MKAERIAAAIIAVALIIVSVAAYNSPPGELATVISTKAELFSVSHH